MQTAPAKKIALTAKKHQSYFYKRNSLIYFYIFILVSPHYSFPFLTKYKSIPYMRICLFLAVITAAAAICAAPIESIQYNPREVSVKIPDGKDGSKEIKIRGDWFDSPVSGIGEKVIGGDSPISAYNNAMYYLKKGNIEKFSSFYPKKMREKMSNSKLAFIEQQIKGYILSGDYCFIICTNGSFTPLKLDSGKWTISTGNFPTGELAKYYPILESLNNSPHIRNLKISNPRISKKPNQKLPELCKKIIDDFRASQDRGGATRQFYLAYIQSANGENPKSEFLKLSDSMRDPRANVKIKNQGDSTLAFDIDCNFKDASYKGSLALPDKNGIECILIHAFCDDKNKSEKVFLILFSL